MKYLIKGEIGLKIGGEGSLLPEICDFHVGAILTDDSMALVIGQNAPPRLGTNLFPQLPITATQPDWWPK